MKYCCFLLLVTTSFTFAVNAQGGRTIRVKSGEDLAKAYSVNGFYRFPEFENATLYFGSQPRKSGVLFNYNLLISAVQFISPKGDTLDLVNSPAPDSIKFENLTLIYNQGYMELVAKSDSIQLLKKISIRTQSETIGAYGVPNTTGAITKLKDISIRGSVYSLVVNEDIVLYEEVGWFLMIGNSTPVKANKSNLLKLLPAEKQAKAEAFLKKNRISFQDEEDLRSLFASI